MAAARQIADTPTLNDLAREALNAHDGKVDRATQALAARLSADRSLFGAVLQQVVADAVFYRTQAAVRSERASVIRRATDTRAGVVALAGGLAASLLDMPLAGGIRLRSCDRIFVQAEADRFRGLATDCARKARFLALLAQSVPDGKVVGDVVSDARALELWEGASHGDL